MRDQVMTKQPPSCGKFRSNDLRSDEVRWADVADLSIFTLVLQCSRHIVQLLVGSVSHFHFHFQSIPFGSLSPLRSPLAFR
jgi:hypothetical protein